MSIFNGSNGDDTITPELVSADVIVTGSPKTPSAANDQITAGNGNDIVAGGGGDDRASLGDGTDTFVWRAGDGNDIVDGGPGFDRLVFGGSATNEAIAVSTGAGGVARVTRDAGNVTMNVTGVERIDIAALEGQDRVTVNDLSHTDVRDVFVDLAGTANPTAGDGQADVVAVNGTASADTILVARDGTSVVVDGLLARTTIEHADASVDRLVINAGGGNDIVTATNGLSTMIQLTIDGGAGNDIITGSDGADLLLGGDGNDVIRGGIGSDTAQLGSGDDTFVWGPGDGSDVVEGNSGNDTLQFNGSNIGEDIALAANGSHALLTRSVAGVAMDLHGVETVNIATLGGTDNVTIGDLTGTGIKQVHVDLGAFDGGDDGAIDTVAVGFTAGNDAIEFNVKPGPAVVNSLGGAQVFVDHQGVGDRFLIDGGAGNDSVSANGTGGDDVIGIVRDSTNSVAVFAQSGQPVSVTGVEQLLVKGGAGNDTIAAQNGIASQVTQLTIDGGAGNDIITGGDGADLLLGGDGNDVIRGGIGSDTAQLGSGDDTFVWGPGDGSDIVEGNSGNDTMQFNGSNIGEDIALSANGSHALLTRSVAGVAMDLHGMETVNIATLGGADNIAVGDMRGTGVKQVHVDLAAFDGVGDQEVDNVTINGTAGNDVIKLTTRGDGALVVGGLSEEVVIEHFDATDVVHIAGLGGHDIIDTSALGASHPKISFDGVDVPFEAAATGAQNGGPSAPVQSIVGAGHDSSMAHFDFGAEQHAPDHEQVSTAHADHPLL